MAPKKKTDWKVRVLICRGAVSVTTSSAIFAYAERNKGWPRRATLQIDRVASINPTLRFFGTAE